MLSIDNELGSADIEHTTGDTFGLGFGDTPGLGLTPGDAPGEGLGFGEAPGLGFTDGEGEAEGDCPGDALGEEPGDADGELCGVAPGSGCTPPGLPLFSVTGGSELS